MILEKPGEERRGEEAEEAEAVRENEEAGRGEEVLEAGWEH